MVFSGQQDNAQAAVGAPSPDALLPTLDERKLAVLRQVGQEWNRLTGDPQAWQRALPVDPNLGGSPDAAELRPTRFGRFVPLSALDGQPPAIEATAEAEEPPSQPGRLAYQLRRITLGPPLDASAIAVERMRKLVALPVLSADALSSVAYGPEAMLAVLVLGGSAALGYSLPIAAAIAFLILAVGVSYRQTIRAYPHGGGSYIVATENLGRVPGLAAAAGLLTDYILTVAVSIASGVAAVTSAVPALAPAAVPIGTGTIAVLLAGNLRGVRQAATVFAAPTYAFIIAIFALITAGLVAAAGRGFHPLPPPRLPTTEAVNALLVLRAFSSGATAMTGVEAVSNAVPAFKPVEWRNARTTLTWMVALLITMFAGIVVLDHLDGLVPNGHQTLLSQLAHRDFGTGFMYSYVQGATAAVLLLAANTSYNDFPRVLFLLARSYHAPRLFLRVGDRLAFTNGIIVAVGHRRGHLRRLPRQHRVADPAVRGRRVPRLHTVADRHGGSLVAAQGCPLAQEPAVQRPRRDPLGDRLRHRRGHQVHRGRLGGRARRRPLRLDGAAHPAPLRPRGRGHRAAP